MRALRQKAAPYGKPIGLHEPIKQPLACQSSVCVSIRKRFSGQQRKIRSKPACQIPTKIRLWRGKGCRTERQAHTQQLTFMRECSMTLDRPERPVLILPHHVMSKSSQ